MGLPNATYSEVDNSIVPPQQLAGIHGVIAPTLFGQADKPYKVGNVSDLTSLFGGPDAIKSPYFAQLRRAVARGTILYIHRLLATGASAATHAFGNEKVTITALDVGTWANGTLGILYTPVANGKCTLQVVYSVDSLLNEVWTADTFDDLIVAVNAGSSLINITTQQGYTQPPDSAGVPVYLADGSDGAFANDAAKLAAVQAALVHFNDLTGLDSIQCLGYYTETWLEALDTYVAGRKDLIGLFEIDPALTAAQAKTFAQAMVPKDSYIAVYWGSMAKAYSPEDAKDVDGPVLADVASVWAYSDTVSGTRYRAPAGGTRGLIPNVKSFASNLLSPARKTDADSLSDLGVNIVGAHPTFGPVVWGAATRNLQGSALDAIHVRRMLIDLSGKLMPIFQGTVFDPNDPTTWRLAYGKAKPIMARLESDRAIYPGWAYIGDQEASRIQDATYNKPDDLANGLYKVLITMVPVGYIKGINFIAQVNSLQSLFQTTAQ